MRVLVLDAVLVCRFLRFRHGSVAPSGRGVRAEVTGHRALIAEEAGYFHRPRSGGDATPDSISDTARFNPADVVAVSPFRKVMVLGRRTYPRIQNY
jgi:hypothetical protein